MLPSYYPISIHFIIPRKAKSWNKTSNNDVKSTGKKKFDYMLNISNYNCKTILIYQTGIYDYIAHSRDCSRDSWFQVVKFADSAGWYFLHFIRHFT